MNAPKINGEGKRILVVDDDLAIRVLLQAVLRRLRFEVDLAEDGQAGLEKVASNQYQLVLLDLMMPRLNGYEFIAQMRESTKANKPHIIVFTAAGQRGVEKIPAGAICNSILKPFDLERFLEMIDHCFRAGHSPAASA